MDFWSMYFKEREGFETVKCDQGIASYKINGDVCYIRDIYVLPEFRTHGIGTYLADEITKIAVANGCKYLTGSVVPDMKGASGSMMALLKYGFKLSWSDKNYICLVKEL